MRFFLWFIVFFPIPLYSQDASVDFVQYRYKIAFLPNQDEPYTGNFNYVSKKVTAKLGLFLTDKERGYGVTVRSILTIRKEAKFILKPGLKKDPQHNG